jgi:hypothetical protein
MALPDVLSGQGEEGALGRCGVRGRLAGSHLAPRVTLEAEAPAARLRASGRLSQEVWAEGHNARQL